MFFSSISGVGKEVRIASLELDGCFSSFLSMAQLAVKGSCYPRKCPTRQNGMRVEMDTSKHECS